MKKFIQNLGFKNISLQKYKLGEQNDSYLLKADNKRYTVRVFNHKKISQIRFEVILLNHIKGLEVPRLIKTKDRYIHKYKGKYIVVYEYIPGRHKKSFSDKELYEVGKFLGKFHNKGKGFRMSKEEKLYDLPDAKISKMNKSITRSNITHKKLLPFIIEGLKESKLSKRLPKGPIHVDVKPDNILFKDGEVSGVLDFDNSYIGPYILDLAKSMVWFGSKNKKFKMPSPIYKGYIKERKLNKLEEREMDNAITFAFLSHVFVDYYMRARKVTSKKYFDFIVNEFYQSYLDFKGK